MKNEIKITQEDVIHQLNRFAKMFIRCDIVRGEFRWKAKAIIDFGWQKEVFTYLQSKALEDQAESIIEDKLQEFSEPDLSWIEECIQDERDNGCREYHNQSENI